MDYTDSLGRSLDNVSNDFERGVLMAVYSSAQQKRRRALIVAALTLKHTLRGLLFSWPLYMIGLAAFVLPGKYSYLLSLFLLPGLYVSLTILKKGLSEDYRRFVKNIILKPEAFKQILFTIRAP